jgi:hypothetical protein
LYWGAEQFVVVEEERRKESGECMCTTQTEKEVSPKDCCFSVESTVWCGGEATKQSFSSFFATEANWKQETRTK